MSEHQSGWVEVEGGPGSVEGAVAEDVEPVPAEAVPVTGGEAQLIAHRLPQHRAAGVVPAEDQRIV